MSENEIIMDMLGFGCASCVYTIEKFGRKIDGLDSIHVSLADHEVRVTYSGDRRAIIAQLITIANRIGHDIRERPQ